MTKKIYLLVLVLPLLLGASCYKQTNTNQVTYTPSNFKECLASEGVIMESYPRKCMSQDGSIFSEYIGNELEKTDLIKIDDPRPNMRISSPLNISGEARGYWYFEASFPVKLYDANNQLLASGIATAQSEWMTEDFVPYQASLNFNQPNTQYGTLVLERDNPSGMPENDDSLIVPIEF